MDSIVSDVFFNFSDIIFSIADAMNVIIRCPRSVVDYGFSKEAGELAEKTISLLGKSITDCGEMYEYYDPDSGEGVINPGFQNWNLLVNNMIAWYNGEPRMVEF